MEFPFPVYPNDPLLLTVGIMCLNFKLHGNISKKPHITLLELTGEVCNNLHIEECREIFILKAVLSSVSLLPFE